MSIADDAFVDLSQAKSIADPHAHLPAWVKPFSIILLLIFMSVAFIYYFLYFENQKPSAAFDKQASRIDQSHITSVTPVPVQSEIIGFLPHWAVGNKHKVHTEHLTQIIYFGFTVNEQGEILTKTEDGQILNELRQLNSDYFKSIRTNADKNNTKILVTLKNFEGVRINQLITNDAAITKFIAQSNNMIDDYDLDGINIDFEYFSYSDFPTMRYLNPFLEKYVNGIKEKHPNAIISFDVNATVVMQDNAYDMVKIGEIVDQVILMAYDYHRPTSTKAGHIAPIDSETDSYTVKASLESMYGRVPHKKIILAVPFYGYEWQTVTKEHSSKTVENTGAVATYERVQQLVDARTGVQVQWDEQAQSPWLVYTHNGLIKQIYFENEASLQKKVELIKTKGLGGVAVWSIGYEGEYEQPWLVLNGLRK